jgi:ubiquinone/menaquinone biosynthesis C-methylase UbiE
MDDHFEKDRLHHEAIAHEYDAIVVDPRAVGNDLLFRRFDRFVKPGRRMLDVACGTGHMLLRFGGRFREVLAVDHSQAMLAQARRKVARRGWSHVRFECGDVPAFLQQQPPQGFDLITCVGFLHHLLAPDVAPLVARLARRLNAGGLLLVSEPVKIAPDAVPARLDAWNRGSVAARSHYTVQAEEPDEEPLDAALLLNAFTAAGLTIEQSRRSFEIFPHHAVPSLRGRLTIWAYDRRYGRSGNVLTVTARRPGA